MQSVRAGDDATSFTREAGRLSIGQGPLHSNQRAPPRVARDGRPRSGSMPFSSSSPQLQPAAVEASAKPRGASSLLQYFMGGGSAAPAANPLTGGAARSSTTVTASATSSAAVSTNGGFPSSLPHVTPTAGSGSQRGGSGLGVASSKYEVAPLGEDGGQLGLLCDKMSDPSLALDSLSEQFDRARQYLDKHSSQFTPQQRSVLQVRSSPRLFARLTD